MTRVENHLTGLTALFDCPICRGGNLLILDVLQVQRARERWQWADLGPGANYCPCSWEEGRYAEPSEAA